jgi:hypothetical protein
MLTKIMEKFREAGEPLDLELLSRELGTDRSALEGMLQTLVRQGKLKEVKVGGEGCAHCRSRGTCPALQSDLLGTVYELAEKR